MASRRNRGGDGGDEDNTPESRAAICATTTVWIRSGRTGASKIALSSFVAFVAFLVLAAIGSELDLDVHAG